MASDLVFITSNQHKVRTAQHVCRQFGINLAHQAMELQEIQAEEGSVIAQHKAKQAFKELDKPVVITDDSWSIPGLNGFPGPYMKYMNDWLTPQDFLRLTTGLTDRRIFLRQSIVYQDERTQKVFSVDIEGLLLKEAHGTSPFPIFTIVSFDEGKNSAAEINESGYSAIADRPNAWHELARWLRTYAPH